MLIDHFMPEWDFRNQHDIEINAEIDTVYESVRSVDVSDSTIIRWLFRLRGLPTGGLKLSESGRIGFGVLSERENDELVYGIAGKFWNLNGSLQKVDGENFLDFKHEGFAKAAVNISLSEIDGNKTRLATETRIQTFGTWARICFGTYWAIVEPFSGLIRKEMLAVVKRDSESNA